MYKVALKAFDCRTCIDLASNNIMCIDDWLNMNVKSKEWTGELFYNDEPPDHSCYSYGGHSKGILVWNESEIGWLIHSVPKWPYELLNTIPNSECEYGQSFAWIILSIDKLPIILSQIELMQVHVYHDPQNIFKKLRYSSHSSETLIHLLELSDGIYHIGKNPKWDNDIFENGLANKFPNSTWQTETWSRPGQKPTDHICRIQKVKWGDHIYCDTQDHSKWGISDDDTSIVCVGDINAMLSQFKRGGGFILFKDKKLWDMFKSIIL